MVTKRSPQDPVGGEQHAPHRTFPDRTLNAVFVLDDRSCLEQGIVWRVAHRVFNGSGLASLLYYRCGAPTRFRRSVSARTPDHAAKREWPDSIGLWRTSSTPASIHSLRGVIELDAVRRVRNQRLCGVESAVSRNCCGRFDGRGRGSGSGRALVGKLQSGGRCVRGPADATP